jgi:UDP-N-acetylmuramyl tripeptide synthase
VAWFALAADHPVLATRRAAGECCWTVADGWILRAGPAGETRLLPVAEVPVTLGGAARHNVANCLAAAALAAALGVPDAAIAAALRTTTDRANPGRCNLFDVGGVTVIVDFAHNPHGLAALAPVVERYGTGRRLIVLGQAGDRGNEAIRELARAAWTLRPDHIVLKEMGHYARGRAPGEVAGLLREAFVAAGADAATIVHVEGEQDAVREALRLAGPGDLVLALVHEDVPGVIALLASAGASGI